MSAGKHFPVYTTHNTVELVKGGSEFFGLLKKLIQTATGFIFIRIYIWSEDGTGSSIAEELIQASKRGVKVFVVADGYASGKLSKPFIRSLTANGIYFKFFEPLFKSSHFYFGRRMHEKIFVADGKHALVGGINFADRYNDVGSIPAWLDFALHVEGQAAYELYLYCRQDWKNEAVVTSGPSVTDHLTSVKVIRNDWVKGKHQVWRTFFNWFNQADESITIMCSYFLPGRVLRKHLGMAAKRGVKVKIILAGPSDVMVAKYAERYLYRWMLKNNISVYEYQPSVLHAKMMVVDRHWVTIGSYNVNNVSAYASSELNLNVRNKPFARSVHALLDSVILNDCIMITEKRLVSSNFFKRLLQKISFELIRIVLNLSTFYFKHE